MLTIDQFVQREVVQCVSSLVSTLAQSGLSYAPSHLYGPDIRDLCEQAFELASPIDDWEEAAREAGWYEKADGMWSRGIDPDDGEEVLADSALEACELDDIEPHYREVYEHWSITPWLAERLIAKGEKVDMDFAGMCVWARTTTGQQISADYVIGEIYRDLMAS